MLNTNLNTVNFSNWKPEDLATLLFGIAAGWNINPTPVEDIEDLEGPPESLVDEPDPLSELFFREYTTRDYEQERFILQEQGGLTIDEHGFPIWKSNQWMTNVDLADDIGNCFGTRSGDNPVIKDLPTQASEQRSACGFLPEDVRNLPDRDIPEYYCWKFSLQSAKKRERTFHKWCRWIKDNSESISKLEAGRKRFWARYFVRKSEGTVSDWLTVKHINLIKKYFAKTMGKDNEETNC